MTIDRTNGIQNIPSGQSATLSAPKGSESATLITSASIRDLVRAGWIEGKVVGTNSEGVYRLSTSIGELSISAPKLTLALGGKLMLSYDNSSGRIVYNLSFPQIESTPKEITAPANNGSTAVSRPPPLPLSLAFSEVAPVDRSGLTASGVNGNSTQVLSHVFPSTSNTSFALAVALFPMVVRGGILGRLASDQHNKYASASRLSKMAEEAMLQPIKRIDDSVGYFGWQMPFFSEGKSFVANWYQTEPEEAGSEPAPRKTFLEVEFDFSGVIQIEAVLYDEDLSITLVSEMELDGELLEVLQQLTDALARALKVNIRFYASYGPELIARHSEDKK